MNVRNPEIPEASDASCLNLLLSSSTVCTQTNTHWIRFSWSNVLVIATALNDMVLCGLRKGSDLFGTISTHQKILNLLRPQAWGNTTFSNSRECDILESQSCKPSCDLIKYQFQLTAGSAVTVSRGWGILETDLFLSRVVQTCLKVKVFIPAPKGHIQGWRKKQSQREERHVALYKWD